MHQQVVTSDALSIAKFVQACPQALESAATHGTYLGYPVVAFHRDVELRFLLKNFHADTFTRLHPGAVRATVFQHGLNVSSGCQPNNQSLGNASFPTYPPLEYRDP
ncbi:MAG: hypothetical protein UZ01_00141 [Candidatus Brocadia sinica]|nr:MAG: hypothetical protein UZ01_00141 [Candidatus Brocadia sinica]